jgi:hypothetical protein
LEEVGGLDLRGHQLGGLDVDQSSFILAKANHWPRRRARSEAPISVCHQA